MNNERRITQCLRHDVKCLQMQGSRRNSQAKSHVDECEYIRHGFYQKVGPHGRNETMKLWQRKLGDAVNPSFKNCNETLTNYQEAPMGD